ncbi:MAG: hypothetical protein KZQ89_06220 [Candidatus Thiodiazotropha sp. (ex Lucinoma kastoroae)]|nr:hypothetical protein [Candidatus Thiodiazotropha sp. (ex Rostrolucina anterorostrata)]MCU7847591.1 hypothetical protein [Candidatus Thiodiazotropha sp. (ex Lucinoma kastoroae)]MCU7860704.1 hypothetical protein [Candidatus Thiodiazotropha sp. (ex Lucinoma kastoroae)]
MILIEDGKSFKLKIEGYEFNAPAGCFDDNWLTINIDVSDGDLHWVAKDNCLLSGELLRLRDWVSGLKESNENEMRFTENELAF